MIVISKLQFYFSNTHLTVKSLLDLENSLVRLVCEWFSLNTPATRSFMFVPKCNGGLGLRNPMTLYNSKRVSILLSVLNSKDTLVRKVARESLALHMCACKVLKAPDGAENQFLGYVVDSEYKVVKGSKQCWRRSDWIKLNEICIRIGIKAVQLCNHPHDKTSHMLNGCMNFRHPPNYTKRHDRIVNILFKDLAKMFGYAGCKLYTNTPFNPNMLAEGQPGALDTIASKPDIILIDEAASKVYIIEVSCPFDVFLEENYDHKFAKYMPLCQAIQQADYDTKVLVFMVGSLGGVHHRVVPGLQLLRYSRGD